MSLKKNNIDTMVYFDKYFKTTTSYSSFVYVKTRFKYNFKYFMNLIVNTKSLLFFNYRSLLSFNLKKLNKQDRYATQNFVVMLLLHKIVETFSFNFFYYYRNVSMFHFVFVRDFFKLVKGYRFKEFRVFFGMGLSCNLNRYFKKVKTRKKFKKKMFYKEFLYTYSTIFLTI